MTAVKARRPRRTLTPVTVTKRFRSFRSGRLETGKAAPVTACGYDRMEISGTPWDASHLPAGIAGGLYGTLSAARAATADGSALAYVERIQAHERGEHKAERDIRAAGA